MPNMLYPMCALMGHCWDYVRTSKLFIHYECRLCDKRRKEER